MIRSSALEAIGNTPLIALDRVWRGPGRILAKAEFMQPGGSVKDRAARAIMEAAKLDGRLQPGMPVVEMTSGNMGAGLAVVCAALEHPLIITMSAGNSRARADMLKAMGAEVILVPQVEGAPGEVTGRDIEAAAQLARSIAIDRSAFYVDQFSAVEAITAHETTGAEILADAGGGIAAWVAGVGTGCTFMGVARALKRANAAILCAAAEPEGCRPLSGESVIRNRHILQGTGYGKVPPHWDPTLMDLSLAVTDDEASEWKLDLARLEGLHVGYSAAANVCGASKLLRSGMLGPRAVVVTVLCDTGLKY